MPAAAERPCDLLTSTQIEAATGWTVEAGAEDTAAPDTAGSVCNWERADREAAVHLQVHRGGGTAMMQARRSARSGRGGNRVPTPVEIKGTDEAFEVAADGLLAFRVGHDYVQLSVIGGDASPDDHQQLGADVAAALR